MSNLLKYEHLTPFSSTEGYWNSENCIQIAKDVLSITKASIMLEIGFNIGYSAAIWLDEGITDLSVIDIGRHPDTNKALLATANHYRNKNIGWWIGDSTSQEAKNLEISNIELAFIDGEHSYSAAFSDALLSIQYGAKWLVFDDVIQGHSNGIYEAISKLVDLQKLTVLKTYNMTWVEQGEVYLCAVIK